MTAAAPRKAKRCKCDKPIPIEDVDWDIDPPEVTITCLHCGKPWHGVK